MKCAMNDREYPDYTYGIWDDGEFISWDYINGHLHEHELRQEFPLADPRVVEVFQSLLDSATEYKNVTGNYLQIGGELGELYADEPRRDFRRQAHG